MLALWLLLALLVTALIASLFRDERGAQNAPPEPAELPHRPPAQRTAAPRAVEGDTVPDAATQPPDASTARPSSTAPPPYDPTPLTTITVVDYAGGAPIGTAIALPRPRDTYIRADEQAEPLRADEHGVISLRPSRAERLSFVVSAPGYAAEWLSGVDPGTRTRVQLGRGATLMIRCVDESGAALRAPVLATATQRSRTSARPVAWARGAGGEVRLTLPVADRRPEFGSGAFDVLLSIDGFRDERLDLAPWGADEGERTATVTFLRPQVVRGIVLDATSGSPIPDALVDGMGGAASSDAAGRFELPTPRVQTTPVGHEIRVVHPSYRDHAARIEAPDGEDLTVRLVPAVAVDVVVEFQRGLTTDDPVSVSVVADRPQSRARIVRRIDERPAFRVSGLTVGERYIGTVTIGPSEVARFRFEASASADVEVRVAVAPTRRLRGRAVDRAGSPITGARCMISPLNETGGPRPASETGDGVLLDEFGRFELTAPTARQRILLASRRTHGGFRRGSSLPVDVPAGDEALDLGDVVIDGW